MKGLDLKGLFRKLPSQCLPLEVEETGSKRTPFISLPPEMMNEAGEAQRSVLAGVSWGATPPSPQLHVCTGCRHTFLGTQGWVQTPALVLNHAKVRQDRGDPSHGCCPTCPIYHHCWETLSTTHGRREGSLLFAFLLGLLILWITAGVCSHHLELRALEALQEGVRPLLLLVQALAGPVPQHQHQPDYPGQGDRQNQVSMEQGESKSL